MNTLFISIKDFSKVNMEQKSTQKSKQRINNLHLSIWDYMSHFKIRKYKNQKSGFDYVLFIDSNYDSLFAGTSKITRKMNTLLVNRLYNLLRKYFYSESYLDVVLPDDFCHFKCNKHIIDILKKSCNFEINFLKVPNNMLKHDMCYISKYLENNNIAGEGAYLLVLLSYINDTIEKKIVEYISEYKFLDVLVVENITSLEYSKIKNVIDKINYEYGTTIEIINKKNLEEYNVCISYLDVYKSEIITKYIFNNKSKYIDMNDKESDYLDDNVILYNENEKEIKKWFEYICLDTCNYSKNLLGKLYGTKQS